MRRSELSQNSRIASSRLRFFRRLCHRDLLHTAFCRELQHLAARLAPRNSTAGLWTETAARWPQGLHKALAHKNSLEDLKVETFAGSQEEAANYSVMASVESPLPGASPTVDIRQAEPLQAPGTERWHLVSWAQQKRGYLGREGQASSLVVSLLSSMSPFSNVYLCSCCRRLTNGVSSKD